MKKIILQTLEILNHSEKKKLKIILFLTVISNFLETLSISLIFPLVGNLTNTNDKNQFLNFSFFNNIFSDNNLTNVFLIFLLVFFLKLVFILFFLYKKTAFIQLENAKAAFWAKSIEGSFCESFLKNSF